MHVCWEGTSINLAWTKPSLGEAKKTVTPGEYLWLNSSQEESKGMYHERFHSLNKFSPETMIWVREPSLQSSEFSVLGWLCSGN